MAACGTEICIKPKQFFSIHGLWRGREIGCHHHGQIEIGDLDLAGESARVCMRAACTDLRAAFNGHGPMRYNPPQPNSKIHKIHKIHECLYAVFQARLFHLDKAELSRLHGTSRYSDFASYQSSNAIVRTRDALEKMINSNDLADSAPRSRRR